MITKPNHQNHYNWGDSCDGWVLTQTQELSIVEERMLPNTEEAMHYHQKSRQYFRVLSGTLSMEMGGNTLEIAPGEGLEVPPGVLHKAFNHSNDDCVFLVISAPGTKSDRHVI